MKSTDVVGWISCISFFQISAKRDLATFGPRKTVVYGKDILSQAGPKAKRRQRPDLRKPGVRGGRKRTVERVGTSGGQTPGRPGGRHAAMAVRPVRRPSGGNGHSAGEWRRAVRPVPRTADGALGGGDALGRGGSCGRLRRSAECGRTARGGRSAVPNGGRRGRRRVRGCVRQGRCGGHG